MAARAATRVAARALRAPVRSRRPHTVWAGSDAWRAPSRFLTGASEDAVEAEFLSDDKGARVTPEAIARARATHEAATDDFKKTLRAEVDEMVVRGALPDLSDAQKALLVDWNLRSE